MSYVQKYNILMSNAKRICENKDSYHFDKAKFVHDIFKSVEKLRYKEDKKYKESLLNNSRLFIILDNMLSESEMLIIAKSKKIKKNLMMCLLDDIFDYIEKNNRNKNNDACEIITLSNLTNFLFNPAKNFKTDTPILYKISSSTFSRIRDIINNSDKRNLMPFDISNITDNIHIINEYNKMNNTLY
jgi:hypothetical protein